MDHVARVVPSAMLKEINESSVEYGFNRTISEDAIGKMDKCLCIVYPRMIHAYAGGERHEKLHMRCEIVFSMSDWAIPVSAFLDIEAKIFDSLPKYSDLNLKEKIYGEKVA
jgi:hypothetical protein